MTGQGHVIVLLLTYSIGRYLQKKEIGPVKGKAKVPSLFCIQPAILCTASRHILDVPRSVLLVQHAAK